MRKHRALSPVVIAVSTLLLGACAGPGGGVPNVAPGQHTIVYKVTANGKATINYTLGGTTKQEETSSDWTKQQKLGGTDAAAVGVVASMQGATTVTCEIVVDGKSVAKQSGLGTIPTALCSTVS